MTREFLVYILSNRNRILYVGVTGDLVRRLAQHRSGTANSFTRRYNVHRLVYVESTTDAMAAIRREKQIKSWNRSKKVALIERLNPTWRTLAEVTEIP